MPDLSKIQFRAGDLAAPLAQRGEREGAGNIARRDLGRYYALLARELAAVQLTEAEASLLCDAGNGTLFEPSSIPLLWAEVDDAIRGDGLDRKWGVDGPALVAKLRALTPGQHYAVVDAIERFWQPGHVEDLSAQLRAVGLVR